MPTCGTDPIRPKDAFVAAGLTLASGFVVAGIMIIGGGDLTETIGLVMFPGVLAVGSQWIYLRGCSGPAKLALTLGPLVVLFLIGLATGLAVGD